MAGEIVSSVLLRDGDRLAEDRKTGNAPEEHDDFRVDDRDLRKKVRPAVDDVLPGGRSPRRQIFDRAGDIDLMLMEPDILYQCAEIFARSPDKRASCLCLLFPGGLPDEHDFRIRIPLSRHRLSRAPSPALRTRFDFRSYPGQFLRLPCSPHKNKDAPLPKRRGIFSFNGNALNRYVKSFVLKKE